MVFLMWRTPSVQSWTVLVKQNLTRDVTNAGSNAARLRTFNLDAVTPLVFILEEAQKGTLTSQSATEPTEAVLLLLGNG